MTVIPNASHFLRLLDVLLPKGGAVMAVCEGYFDESGAFAEKPPIFCVSGYFIMAEAARRMADEWVSVLAEYGVPYFHMVDCAHADKSQNIFTPMGKDRRIELVTTLIGLIKKHTLSGFSVIAHGDHFKKSPQESEEPDVYSNCVDMCVSALRSFVQVVRIDGDIAYFFESGHTSQGQAYNRIADRVAEMSASVTFAGKEKVPLLQAADLLAWQTTKFVKDDMSQARKPRKDFVSLMEHQHSFNFIRSKGEDGLFIGVLDWPATRRSRHAVTYTLHKDGPIDYICEGNDETPIIMVMDPIGWRPGGGQLVYVTFDGAQKKHFSLAFDRSRLELTIKALQYVLDDADKAGWHEN